MVDRTLATLTVVSCFRRVSCLVRESLTRRSSKNDGVYVFPVHGPRTGPGSHLTSETVSNRTQGPRECPSWFVSGEGVVRATNKRRGRTIPGPSGNEVGRRIARRRWKVKKNKRSTCHKRGSSSFRLLPVILHLKHTTPS